MRRVGYTEIGRSGHMEIESLGHTDILRLGYTEIGTQRDWSRGRLEYRQTKVEYRRSFGDYIFMLAYFTNDFKEVSFLTRVLGTHAYIFLDSLGGIGKTFLNSLLFAHGCSIIGHCRAFIKMYFFRHFNCH